MHGSRPDYDGHDGHDDDDVDMYYMLYMCEAEAGAMVSGGVNFTPLDQYVSFDCACEYDVIKLYVVTVLLDII